MFLLFRSETSTENSVQSEGAPRNPYHPIATLLHQEGRIGAGLEVQIAPIRNFMDSQVHVKKLMFLIGPIFVAEMGGSQKISSE
jgi:hypothetical protein